MGLALAITAAIVAAFWIGGSLEWAIPAAILMLGFIAAMALRDRSQTAETLYGVGDERTRRLHQRTRRPRRARDAGGHRDLVPA